MSMRFDNDELKKVSQVHLCIEDYIKTLRSACYRQNFKFSMCIANCMARIISKTLERDGVTHDVHYDKICMTAINEIQDEINFIDEHLDARFKQNDGEIPF